MRIIIKIVFIQWFIKITIDYRYKLWKQFYRFFSFGNYVAVLKYGQSMLSQNPKEKIMFCIFFKLKYFLKLTNNGCINN